MLCIHIAPLRLWGSRRQAIQQNSYDQEQSLREFTFSGIHCPDFVHSLIKPYHRLIVDQIHYSKMQVSSLRYVACDYGHMNQMRLFAVTRCQIYHGAKQGEHYPTMPISSGAEFTLQLSDLAFVRNIFPLRANDGAVETSRSLRDHQSTDKKTFSSCR